jgi:hypothetical protein
VTVKDVDVREQVLNAVTVCMNRIFKAIPAKDFEAEADALMQKWVNDHGRFGIDGIVDAVTWWQDQATETNAFPLTRN